MGDVAVLRKIAAAAELVVVIEPEQGGSFQQFRGILK